MKKHQGFTLIELAIVIVIIGILVAVATISMRGMQAAARDKERDADVATIATFLESIYPREIKDSTGAVIKSAGSYPALSEDVDQDESKLIEIFKDVDRNVLKSPTGKYTNIIPWTTKGSGYPPSQQSSPCGSYLACYEPLSETEGSINGYYYFPLESNGEICTSSLSDSLVSSRCREFVILYRKEVGDVRVEERSKRR